MIYSVVPFDQVLFNTQVNTGERMEVTLDGERVVLLRNENNTYSIERLISTNPRAYMKPELKPGTLLMTITGENKTPNVTWQIMNKSWTQPEK